MASDGANTSTRSEGETPPGELIDVSLLKEIAKKALVDSLNSINGSKTLVLDATLSGPLGLITDVGLLKHHGVEKMYWLEPGPLSVTSPNTVYLCRPLITNIKIVADQIKQHSREGRKCAYTLLLVPRTSELVSRILEEEGILGDVTISAFNLQFIPIAEDVISLENRSALKDLWVDGDETVIFDSMQALVTLQKLYGRFPRIIGKGDCAARLATLLERQHSQLSDEPETLLSGSHKIDSLIIIDRKVDMITPLLTQLTYEGLIDELIGIEHSQVELPASILSPPTATSNQTATAGSSTAPPATAAPSLAKDKKKKYHLSTGADPLLAELRDLNFSSVGKKLSSVAHRINQDYNVGRAASTVPQLRDFVGKLGGLQGEHQALRIHTSISEILVPLTHTDHFNKSLEIQQNLLASYDANAQVSAIEDMVAQGADMQTVVRLLCLASLTAGGVKLKALESIKREILQSYGYKYLPLLLSLSSSSLGIILPNPLPPSTPASVAASKYPFTTLRKSLRLLIDDTPEAIDEVENDISFVYSGYAPISIRLVQCVAQKGGVISNPAEREKSADSGSKGGKGKANTMSTGKVQAHPIVGWKGFDDVLSVMPGQTFDIIPKGVARDAVTHSVAAMLRPPDQSTTTVVFFLGGCTYTELAALRWVARQNRGRQFLVATTGMVSGASIVESIASLGAHENGSKEVGI